MSAGIGAALGDPNIEIYATLGEPHEIAAMLSDLRYLVFEGMKGDPGDPAMLVCSLLEDGTLYVDNMTAMPDYDTEVF